MHGKARMKERAELGERAGLKEKKERGFQGENISLHFKFFIFSFLPISVESLLLICSQITEGMSYLEDLRVVHRDLAAR